MPRQPGQCELFFINTNNPPQSLHYELLIVQQDVIELKELRLLQLNLKQQDALAIRVAQVGLLWGRRKTGFPPQFCARSPVNRSLDAGRGKGGASDHA